MPQKTITETTPSNPKPLPQKIELTQPQIKPPTVTTKESIPPIQQVQKPKPPIVTPQPQYTPIPKEIKILLDALEEFEGIAYAARNKIYQLYGPVDYQIQNSTKHKSLDDIRFSFPEEIEAKLNFIEQDNKFIVKAKEFLGTETFAKIASTIRGMGGQYVSAGKDSHFEIRKY